MISYELPLIITVLPVVMVVSSLTPDRIVAAQAGYTLAWYHAGLSLPPGGQRRLFSSLYPVWWSQIALRSMSPKGSPKLLLVT